MGSCSLIDWFASPGGVVGSTTKSLLLDTMLAMFMIGMPVLWTMVMGWAGIHIGRSIQESYNLGKEGQEKAGGAGIGPAKAVTSNAIGKRK